jgi:hypothetical protein
MSCRLNCFTLCFAVVVKSCRLNYFLCTATPLISIPLRRGFFTMFYRLFFALLFHDVCTVKTQLLRLVRINDHRCHCTALAALFFSLTTARLAGPARAGQQDKSGRGTGQFKLAPLCPPSKTRPRVHRHVTCGPGRPLAGPPCQWRPQARPGPGPAGVRVEQRR